jgi:hypothetical protein
MKKMKCESSWRKCGLCGKTIKQGDEYYAIKYQQQTGSWGATRYRSECWHLNHIKLVDYSKKCKSKINCITEGKSGFEMGCGKKICIYFK